MDEAVDAQCSMNSFSCAERSLRLGAKPAKKFFGAWQYNWSVIPIDAAGIERLLRRGAELECHVDKERSVRSFHCNRNKCPRKKGQERKCVLAVVAKSRDDGCDARVRGRVDV